MSTINSSTYTAQTAASARSGSMVGTAELTSGKLSFLQVTVSKGAGALSAADSLRRFSIIEAQKQIKYYVYY